MGASETAVFQRRMIEVLTFILVFSSMALAFSLMPVMPQPVPVIISFLIGFLAFRKPRLGLMTGSLLIGISLIHGLSQVNFIFGLNENNSIRLLFVVAVLGFFALAPYDVENHEDAIAVAVGIIAAMLLFYPVYFLAIPMILVFSVLYKRKKLVLTLSYYSMISVPVQIVQFFDDLHSKLPSAPDPLPLLYGQIKHAFNPIYPFNMEEIGKAVATISKNIAGEYDADALAVGRAIGAYFNSLAGIAIYLIIISGLISVSAFATLVMLKMLKEIERTRKYAKYFEIFLPTITAVVFAQIFWIVSTSLRGPTLRIDVAPNDDITIIMIGTLVALIGVTLPISVADYMLKIQTLIEQLSKNLLEKVQGLLSLLQAFKEKLKTVKSSIPISISPIEGKVLLIEDKLNETASRTSKKIYDLPTIHEKFEEVEKSNDEVGVLSTDLDVSLEEYYTRMAYEYLGWIEKLKDLEIESEKTVEIANTNLFRSLTIESKVDAIKNVIEAGRLLTREVLSLFNEIYSMVRSIYDQNLPIESSTVKFVQHTLEEGTTPWGALESLFTAMQNFDRQYGSDVSKSINNLQSSLSKIVDLSAQSEKMLPILGDAVPQILDLAKKGEEIIKNTEKKKTSIMKVTLVKEALQSTLGISTGILKTLYNELVKKERTIESLLPTKEYEWGKNTFITEKLETVIGIVSHPSEHNLDVVMDNLYKSLAYIETCIETINAYSKEHELLLNYPIAELVIDNILEHEDHVIAEDLPFKFEYAREYLRLYSRQKYAEVSFDDSSNILEKRVQS